MAQLPAKPVPKDFHRVALVNPTKYLGNLLIAGGLIQNFHSWCVQNDREVLIVLDESFRALVGDSLPGENVLYYPRRRIEQATLYHKLRLYTECLKSLRRFRADLAFNIEEDSVSHRLTQLSGARFRLGCSSTRHGVGYDHVAEIGFTGRPEGKKHRWHCFQEMFTLVGLPEGRQRYMRLQPTKLHRERLQMLGLDLPAPYILVHPSATKEYKKWPIEYMESLCKRLIKKGFFVVLVGAGQSDSKQNTQIMKAVKQQGLGQYCLDLCNRLNLVELVAVMKSAAAMVGNDSGPFHLSAALRVPGVVIFGPTDIDLWSPMSGKSVVIRGGDICDPACTRGSCVRNQRCLKSIKPGFVLRQISRITS